MGLAKIIRPSIVVPTLAVAPNANEQARSIGEFTMQFDQSTDYWGSGHYRGALAIPAVHRSVSLISGLIGSSPLHAYRDRQGLPAERIYPTPAMLEDPSAGVDTRVTVLSSWAIDYLLDGNAIGIVASRDEKGWPTSFVPVPACNVSVRYVDAGAVYGLPALGNMVEYQIGSQVFGPWDVLHIKNVCAPGALRGIGVLEAALGTVQHARELETQARGLATTGVPTGVLKISPESGITDEDDLRAAKAAYMESQRTRTVAALAPGMDFVPIAWNAEELQLIEARKYSDVQIANLFGLRVSYLNGEIGGMNYSSPTLDQTALLATTMNQHLVRFEQALSRHMPVGEWAKFNDDAILSTDTMTRYQAYALAPWMTDDEKRSLEDMPPLPAIEPSTDEVAQALELAKAAPSLVQNPGLPALVDQLLVLNGKEPRNPAPASPTTAEPETPAGLPKEGDNSNG